MKLDEVLSKGSSTPGSARDTNLATLDGAIGVDHDPTMFRLYPDPSNLRYYLLIPKDAVGDIYEWTVDELSRHGVVGAKLYRFSLHGDTQIQKIEITTIKAIDARPKQLPGTMSGDDPTKHPGGSGRDGQVLASTTITDPSRTGTIWVVHVYS